MRRALVLGVLTAVLSFGTAATVQAQGDTRCPEGKRHLNDLLDETLEQVAAAEVAEETEPAAPASDQVDAPASGGESTDLVDGALFPTLLGFALNRSFGAEENNPATLNWSLFGLATMGNRDAFWDDTIYQEKRYERLRRVGGTLSFGGTGKAFDRDGDGEADDALEAEQYDDIVTWEARVRLSQKGRDRRERYNVELFFDELESASEGQDLLRRLHTLLMQEIPQMGAPLDAQDCALPSEWKKFITRSDIRAKFLEASEAARKLAIDWETAAEAVDNRPVATLAVGGVERGDEFGPDERYLALRGSWRGGTANLQYNEADGLGGAPDPTCLKFGLEWAWQWSTRADASLAATYERFHDVPDATHEEIAKAQAKIEYTVAKGVKLPISVTWANHRDLLVDEEEVRGHVGFTLDLAGVLRRLREEAAGS